jgi:hypothetical protein
MPVQVIDVENVETGRPDRILVQSQLVADRRGHGGAERSALLTVIDGEVVFPTGDEFVAEFSRRRFRRRATDVPSG